MSWADLVALLSPGRRVLDACRPRTQPTGATVPVNIGAAAERRMMAATVIASLGPSRWPASSTAARGGDGWDWTRFRGAMQWAGLAALSDPVVAAQAASFGSEGDTINSGEFDVAMAVKGSGA